MLDWKATVFSTYFKEVVSSFLDTYLRIASPHMKKRNRTVYMNFKNKMHVCECVRVWYVRCVCACGEREREK